MNDREAGPLDSDSGVHFGGAVAQTHDEVMRAWEARHGARQRIIANEVASKRDDVRAFRATYLPDGLLPSIPNVIRDWLDARVAEAENVDPDWDKGRTILGSRSETLSVSMGTPADGEPYFRSVPPVLAPGALVQLSRDLGREFGWTTSTAARWVIVRDAIPQTGASPISPNLSESDGLDADGRPWNTWLTFRVPLSFPASRLLREFENAQRLYGEGVSPRPTSPENVALVLFCVDHNDGRRSWLDVLKLWNEQHPEARFEETRKGVHIFAKTVRKTYRAIMGDQLPFAWRTTESDSD
jgi:hypothetical protein